MWTDNDTPGCFFDTIDCTGDCCEEGRKMLEDFLKEKEEKVKEENRPIAQQ